MTDYDPSNPWSYNPFGGAPKAEHLETPKLPSAPRKPTMPRQVPGIDDLFAVQKDLVKALRALTLLEDENQKLDTAPVRFQLENAYKVMNRYLRTYQSK